MSNNMSSGPAGIPGIGMTRVMNLSKDNRQRADVPPADPWNTTEKKTKTREDAVVAAAKAAAAIVIASRAVAVRMVALASVAAWDAMIICKASTT